MHLMLNACALMLCYLAILITVLVVVPKLFGGQ